MLLTWMAMPELRAQTPADSIPAPGSPRFFEANAEEVYKIAEEMPRFPGCENLKTREQKEDCSMRKMLEFLYSRIQIPPAAIDKTILGTVVISFIVEKDGTRTDYRIVKDPGGGYGEECLRVVRLMPDFIPGKQHGAPVRVGYSIPMKINLQ